VRWEGGKASDGSRLAVDEAPHKGDQLRRDVRTLRRFLRPEANTLEFLRQEQTDDD
jgi:hypothetical protein